MSPPTPGTRPTGLLCGPNPFSEDAVIASLEKRGCGATAAHHGRGGEDAGGSVGAADRRDLQVLQPETLVRHLSHRACPPSPSASMPGGGADSKLAFSLPTTVQSALCTRTATNRWRHGAAHSPIKSCASASAHPYFSAYQRREKVPAPSANPCRPQLAFPPCLLPFANRSAPFRPTASQSGVRSIPPLRSFAEAGRS